MFLVIYFTASLTILYTEAMDCHTNKYKFKLTQGLFFSLLWPISLIYSIYLIHKATQKDT